MVKKAKRRNLTEDQKKNVFAGFGGFTSSNKSAEEAFSFLGKASPDQIPVGLLGSFARSTIEKLAVATQNWSPKKKLSEG